MSPRLKPPFSIRGMCVNRREEEEEVLVVKNDYASFYFYGAMELAHMYIFRVEREKEGE